MNGAIARIILRYGVGGVIGYLAATFGVTAAPDLGEKLAANAELVAAVATIVGLAIEYARTQAKKRGWSL
tara:strand:- start:3995 stop:4204 length:210 start_codon:yes stop_codon:yes gene_type:complete